MSPQIPRRAARDARWLAGEGRRSSVTHLSVAHPPATADQQKERAMSESKREQSGEAQPLRTLAFRRWLRALLAEGGAAREEAEPARPAPAPPDADTPSDPATLDRPHDMP